MHSPHSSSDCTVSNKKKQVMSEHGRGRGRGKNGGGVLGSDKVGRGRGKEAEDRVDVEVGIEMWRSIEEMIQKSRVACTCSQTDEFLSHLVITQATSSSL